MFIYNLLIENAYLIIGLMLREFFQCPLGRHTSTHIIFYRINDPVISYAPFYNIIFHPLPTTIPAGNDKVQPLAVVGLEMQIAILFFNSFEVEIIYV